MCPLSLRPARALAKSLWHKLDPVHDLRDSVPIKSKLRFFSAIGQPCHLCAQSRFRLRCLRKETIPTPRVEQIILRSAIKNAWAHRILLFERPGVGPRIPILVAYLTPERTCQCTENSSENRERGTDDCLYPEA